MVCTKSCGGKFINDLFLLGGYLILGVMNREIFPTIDPKIINVTVPYPGASPEDVEEGITQRIEEAVLAVDGIKRISSVAAEIWVMSCLN